MTHAVNHPADNSVHRRAPLCALRMVGLQSAVDLLHGQQAAADAFGINVRSLRAKLTAERGISDDDLRVIAAALYSRSACATDHAAKLLQLVKPSIIDGPVQGGKQ